MSVIPFASVVCLAVGLAPPVLRRPEADRPRLAVLDFAVAGKVDATGGPVLAAVVREEFQRAGRVDLMDREMMRERMTEKDFAATTECDQARCLVQYGKSLEVHKIVGGQAASFGQVWTLSMRLVDVNAGREERTFVRQHGGQMEDLLDIARDGARNLMGLTLEAPVPQRAAQRETLTLDCGRGVTLELILIPAGEFLVGSPPSEERRHENELQHPVQISKPFYLGVTEVTQAQWQAVMGSNPSYFKGDSNRPVAGVNWDECQEFCGKLSHRTGRTVRLPTEAEWEYACRAGSSGRFCFGSTDDSLGQYAWFGRNSDNKTHPVAQKTANVWGLYDMHGNVWEWCQDRYDYYYPPGEQVDPTGPTSGERRVLRGGAWDDPPLTCTCTRRHSLWRGVRFSTYGFRVAVEME